MTVRGRDEVAALGASFNTMADRIRTMITGQKELMAGVSHELRSPLARMKMSLELLRETRKAADSLGVPVSIHAAYNVVEFFQIVTEHGIARPDYSQTLRALASRET